MARRYRGSRYGSGGWKEYAPDPWQYLRVTPGTVPQYKSIQRSGSAVPATSSSSTHLQSLYDLLSVGALYLKTIGRFDDDTPLVGRCTPPSLPKLPDKPREPALEAVPQLRAKPERDQFAPSFSDSDRLLFWRAEQKAKLANRKYAQAMSDWEDEAKAVSRVEEKRAKEVAKYQGELDAWTQRSEPIQRQFVIEQERFDAERAALHEAIKSDAEFLSALRAEYASGAVDNYIRFLLLRSPYPHAFPREVSCRYDGATKCMIVEVELPDSRSFVEGAASAAKPKPTKSARQELVEEVPMAVLIRTLRETVAADESAFAETVVVNGKLKWHDPQTGHARHEIIGSLQASRDAAITLELATLSPRDCYRNLKGAITANLGAGYVEPVIPFLRIEADGRVVASREILDHLPPESNLAEMPWEDFEHLIREVFAKEFASTGAEVNVTRASRDWGVDALVQDPDPIRGGKFVIQAKRYKNVVGVDAVRDLYGTVMNEGANRGILVTTSHFGPQSYEFAKGKPLTLIDGAGLLAMLERHGYKYAISM